MAQLNKVLTYKIPNERNGQSDSDGKTSTQQYHGPEKLAIWLNKDTNNVEQTWDADNEPDRPLPLHLYRVEMDCSGSTEDAIKCGLIHTDCFDRIKKYEIKVGPDTVPNGYINDPTDVMEVYSKDKFRQNAYNPDTGKWKDLEWFEGVVEIKDMERMRSHRNAKLAGSDNMFNEDMPASLKQEWLDYRQQLRDVPELWDGVPTEFLTWPVEPDWAGSPDPDLIAIGDRESWDAPAMEQLRTIKGVDEPNGTA